MGYKKRVRIGMVFMLLLSIAAGCSSKKEDDVKYFDMQKLADQLQEELGFEALIKAEEDVVFDLYPLEKEDVDAYLVYVSSGATTEEIAIFKAREKDKVEDMMASIQTRIADQEESFATYRPEELTRLENKRIEQRGQYVILCISNNPDKALDVIDNVIG